MNAREFAERIGRAHGTVKRWLGLGLPHRKYGQAVVIEEQEARRWVDEYEAKHKGRRRNRVAP